MKKTLKHIRFGVICSGNQMFAWQEIILKKLVSEADIELGLVVFEGDDSGEKTLISKKRDSINKSSILWTLYYRHIVQKKSKALQKVETNTLLEGIPKIYFNPIINNNGFAILEDADVEKIESKQLDFVLDFSSLTLSGNVLEAAKYGIWSYQYGNPERYVGSPSCFWEIYHKDVLTQAYLLRLEKRPESINILKEGCLKTNISYVKNIDKIHFECTDWPLKICQDIRNNQTKNLTSSSKIKAGKNCLPPSNVQLLNFLFVILKLNFKKANKMLFYTDYWNIGIALSPIEEFLNPKKTPSIHWFSNLSKERFMADPFGIYHKDELCILYEDLQFNQGIGKTASFLFEEGLFKENKIVIDEKFHMSYPFLFEYEDEMYCIPETYQANQVRLYKAEDFPNKWNLEKVLIENYAGIDSTLFKHEDIWYLFSTDKNSGPHYNLNIHYSDSILGLWHEHPKNPVKTDIRSARPAGTVFEHGGEVFRPSMDYSEKIEGRIVINKITTLTKNDFKEQMNTVVNPFKNTFFSDKTHTLSQVGDYTLVDGAKELFIFRNYEALKYKARRILNRLKNK